MTRASKGTVLVVDDDEDSRRIFATMLEYAGYTVITAKAGEEGIERASLELPSIILMDVGLPEFDGIEAMRRLRHTPARGIPVVAITGCVPPDERHAVARHGFRQVLLKPVFPKVVLATVEAVLGDMKDVAT